MSSFSIYRLPHADRCTLMVQTAGEPEALWSYAELNGRSGFVLAPFAPSADEPILLIHPDEVQTFEMRANSQGASDERQFSQLSTLDSQLKNDYAIDFANFHAHIANGDFEKLVLSRSLSIERKTDVEPMELFRRACVRYPRMFICLVSTPQSGTWLTATPEVLLSGRGTEWLTIALAGTMPYTDQPQWSTKNVLEQRIVATYITEQLEQFTDKFTERGPRAARAGHLVHLRSDFHFTLYNNKVLGDLLQQLHPTPAVCGLPKREAFDFILHNEHSRRSYYSGFMGPLQPDEGTELYVSLRCMQLFADHYQLYAGGGILPDSVEAQEWQETEAKLDTMRNIIDNV